MLTGWLSNIFQVPLPSVLYFCCRLSIITGFMANFFSAGEIATTRLMTFGLVVIRFPIWEETQRNMMSIFFFMRNNSSHTKSVLPYDLVFSARSHDSESEITKYCRWVASFIL